MARLDVGRPGPLGAHAVDGGVEVAVRSRHAERIELCVFDDSGTREHARFELPGRTGDVFHGRLPDAGPGLVYGLRAHGPYAPRDGHRFNANKLLLDPYAREMVGTFRWDPAVLGYIEGHPDGCESFDTRDSAPCVPKARVAAPAARPPPGGTLAHGGSLAPGDASRLADGGRDRPPKPGRPWHETVLYELHVKGYTAAHPRMPVPVRGTVEALAHPESIAHLRALGVTAVELLPVAAWLDELHLARRGLVNYWGYNPIAFMAMQPTLAGPRGLVAMRDAVDALHAVGIEVILDVVFNHTGEGDERGPTLSLRGLDNATYYARDLHRPNGYRNLSGCGNTLAAWQPAVADLILDSLRFWAGDVGIDGFRFDLASAIARDEHGRFAPELPWLGALRDDPVLARCKLVAESWDCDGHFVGGFPQGWSEWNDRCRDDLRRFWLGWSHGAGALATRLAGSQDVFGHRGPPAGIGFVTAHDGFTLADTVSYRHRRNHANGEDNRDGHAGEIADGGGAEGPTDDPQVRRRRVRRARALLATLMLSRGVPMLRAGDELGATQDGNNNAYCQDGPLTWLAWPADDARGATDPQAVPDAAGHDHRALLGTLARLRAAWPCLRGERFLHGGASHDAEGVPDVVWLREDGASLHDGDWHDGSRRAIAMQLDAGIPRPGASHDRVWIGLWPGDGPIRFVLPDVPHADGWVRALDTADEAAALEVGATREIVVDGPAVVVCACGTIARAERARWRTGLPPAVLVDADDPAATIEAVVDTQEVGGRIDIEVEPTGEAVVASAPLAPARAVARATVDGRLLQRLAARLSVPLRPGAYRARLREESGLLGADCRGRDAAVRRSAPAWASPAHAHRPATIDRAPGVWLLSTQLYALHSAESWGVGDFADLAALATRAGAIGAAGVLVSPVHSPSFGWPDRGSPYSPSSRLALNPAFVSLPLAVQALAAHGFATPRHAAWLGTPATRATIAAVRAAPHVDCAAVVALKRAALEALFDDFDTATHAAPRSPVVREFEAWCAITGTRLRAHLLFEALADAHGVADRAAWPPGFDHPDAPSTLTFEREHPARLRFHAFVQWLADRQWRAAGDAARAAGATIGLVADLAVGADPAGADTWSRPDVVAAGAEIGAPPDAFSADGQAWGLPPWRPDGLEEAGFGPFADLLRATMSGAGGLRIDHVMALERLYWVPHGRRPADGGYVAYPLDAMLRVVAAESARHRCMVIGEDLGTVRPGLRERLAVAGVLSYKVAWFERAADGTLVDPGALPAHAAVSASTHDLPTIDGWVAALDVDERERLGIVDAHAAGRMRAERRDDVARLEAGLARAGIEGDDLCERLHRWLAAASCRVAIVQIEDVAGLARQPNLPGTPDVAPNWRQRLPVSIDGLATLARWRALESIFATRRATIGADVDPSAAR